MASTVVLITVTVAGFLLQPSFAQPCNKTEGRVRLVGGSSKREGRVEICMNGLWGGVCRGESSWSSNNAVVVCQQLGYPANHSSSADYGPGATNIAWISSLSCSGTESSLLECSHGGPTDSCYGNYFAGVTCSQCTNGSIWLEGGIVTTEGNILVCVNGEYVGVCDTNDEWDYEESFVVCRQLGFPATDAQNFDYTYYGEGLVLEIDHVQCYGDETSLSDCMHMETDYNCSIFNTVGVRCQGEKASDILCTKGNVRLADGQDVYEGRVEICSNGVWGTVNDSGWDSRDATVVCRQLGYPETNIELFRSAYFGQGTGPVLFRDFQCDSNEPLLQLCGSNQSLHYYGHSNDAGVRCGHINQTDCVEGSVRLAGGSNSTEGRIEVCHNRIWGTICDDEWSLSDAEVLCHQLGFQAYGAVAHSSAHFGEGSGPYHYSNFRCNGSEDSIFNCSYDDYYSCQPGEEAGVSCKVSVTSCVNGDVRLEGGYTEVEGRVEVCVNGTWGTVCDDNTDQSAFDFICKQYFNISQAYSLNYSTFGSGGGRLMLENLECTGSESNLTDCQYTVSDFTGGCRAYEDAGVRCYNEDPHCYTDDVRLMGGRNESEGRVEVCQNGIWGAVADYSWNYNDAVVTCKQLGYPSNWTIPLHGSFFGRGNAPILISSYNCDTYSQSLSNCSNSSYSISSTGNYNVSGVICQGNTTSVPECTSGDIRLAGGSSEGEGRVEICIDGFWGTVCQSSGFGAEEAVVICKQMGYPSIGTSVLNGGAFGPGDGPIMGQLTCTGGETNIDQCVFGDVGAVDCHHGIDATLTCTANTKLYQYEVSVSKVSEGPVQIGSQVVLHCSVSPSPSGEDTQYRWTSSIPNYHITNNYTQNTTVTIKSGHPETGQYYCHAYNGGNLLGVGHITIAVQSLLYAITSDVLQFTPPETITLQVGVCDKTTQHHFYNLVWYYNGFELTLSNRIYLSNDNMTLTITNMSKDDSGLYEVQYRGIYVKAINYDKQCEEKLVNVLSHYPALQPVKFYVNFDHESGIIPSKYPALVMFNASQAVVPFTDSDNITLTIDGTVHLPISSDVIITRMTLNGQPVPSSFHYGVLQRKFDYISQTLQLNTNSVLNSGVLEAALIIDPEAYFITHLGCPYEYYSTAVSIGMNPIILSASSIGIQYYEPPMMLLVFEKLDLKKGEHSTLNCTATGGYPPIQNVSLLKAGAVLVSTDSSSLSITAGSGLEYGYGHYVCAVNSAGVVRKEKAKIQEQADMTLQLKLENGTSCESWNKTIKEIKAIEFAKSFSLVAQTCCSCDFSVDNMHYSSADCSGGGKTFTVRFTVTYSDENGNIPASTVLDIMEKWAVTGPTLAIDGIQATVSDFSCSTCFDPGHNSGLIAGLLSGGIAIGCALAFIPMILLILYQRYKTKTRISEFQRLRANRQQADTELEPCNPGGRSSQIGTEQGPRRYTKSKAASNTKTRHEPRQTGTGITDTEHNDHYTVASDPTKKEKHVYMNTNF